VATNQAEIVKLLVAEMKRYHLTRLQEQRAKSKV
jgi:ankyrin repeat protein